MTREKMIEKTYIEATGSMEFAGADKGTEDYTKYNTKLYISQDLK